MKTATTSYSIDIQKNTKITREFLESENWILKEEHPLYDTFIHSSSKNLECSVGLYGEFSICELHWCNGTPERIFSTINHKLTKEDYYKILSLLNILQKKK